MNIRFLTSWLLALGLAFQATPVLAKDEVVNVYSARKEALILPLLEKFQTETGIAFKLVTGKADGLLKRLEIEGRMSPADVFITVDAGRLARAKAAGVLQPIRSDLLEQAVPQHMRDRDHYWYGVSQRARTLIYNKHEVNPEELSTYEALTDAQWKGRLCIRSSGNIYNQSLTASMAATQGVEATEAWARGLVANFARPPAGGDTDQLKAVAAGQCDVALANTYYFGRLQNSKKQRDRLIAARLGLHWANQGEGDRGVHVNVSGVGVTKHARNVNAARRLMEFMVRPESQAWYAEVNNEFPVVPDSPISDVLKSWGAFKADTVNLTKLGEYNAAAVRLMDRAGWR